MQCAGCESAAAVWSAAEVVAAVVSVCCDGSAGCSYGGFSCGYWIVDDDCDKYHPETHIVTDDRCPCGNTFPGFGTGYAVSDANDRELPPELRAGIGTPLEREMRA